VGSILGDGVNINQGAAYVFEHNEGIWTEETKLVASDGVTGDEFGHSVCLSNNTALVGADLADTQGNMDQGSAYVFLLGDTCATMPDGTVCDDGNACTQSDTCQNGVCVGANPVECIADICQQSACNPSTGLCMTWPLSDQTPCPDGVCKAGGCYVEDIAQSSSGASSGNGGMGGGGGSGGNSSGGMGGSDSIGNGNVVEIGDPWMRGGGCACNVMDLAQDHPKALYLWLAATALTLCRLRMKTSHLG
jgi:hypothetical protein